jgi:Uma2 family endonuclease
MIGSSTTRIVRDWRRLLNDRSLDDVPYRIETDRFGKVLMTPAKNWHALLQYEVLDRLRAMIPDGKLLTECAIGTADGVKVPDVAWLSAGFLARIKEVDPMLEAPEICVEIVSKGNSKREMDLKRRLYFDAGAKEFWLCNKKGRMRFFTPEGEVEQSRLFPSFPKVVPTS